MLETANRIVDSLFARSLENPSVPLSGAHAADYVGMGTTTTSGLQLSNLDALTYSPVWGAVDMISGDLSTMRLITYRRTEDDRGKVKAKEHGAFNLLRSWTGELTSNLWIQSMIATGLLYGNSYSRIYRGGPDRHPTKLEFIPSHRMRRVERNNVGRVYTYTDRVGNEQQSGEMDIFHLPGLMLSDLGGISLVDFARNTVARYLSAGHYSDEFFANGAKTSGMLKGRAFQKPEAMTEWITKFRADTTGPGNRHRIPWLPEGLDWVETSVNPKDAVLVDMLDLGPRDVANFFKIPSHKVGDTSKTSYNSIEQENLSYYIQCLLYWATRMEYEANHKLFREDEKKDYFAEFNADTFLRTDAKTRAEVDNVGILNGSILRNEARSRLNLNPIDGLDEPLQPLNMVTPSQADAATIEADSDGQTDRSAGQATLVALRDLLSERLSRGMRLMCNEAKRAAGKPAKFGAWLNDNQGKYRHAFESETRDVVRVLDSLGIVTDDIAVRALEAGREGILAASEVQEDQLAESVSLAMEGLTADCLKIATTTIFGGDNHEDP